MTEAAPIFNNTIISNRAVLGGGIYQYLGNNVRFTHHCYFHSNYSTESGGAIYGQSRSTTGIIISHSSFIDNISEISGFNFYNNEDQINSLIDNYFGGETIDKTLMGVCDGTNGCLGTVTITNPQSTPWPLCVDEPSNPDCVGADFEYEE